MPSPDKSLTFSNPHGGTHPTVAIGVLLQALKGWSRRPPRHRPAAVAYGTGLEASRAVAPCGAGRRRAETAGIFVIFVVSEDELRFDSDHRSALLVIGRAVGPLGLGLPRDGQ
jgi:hypothetical protein